jgi:hypothetical protein
MKPDLKTYLFLTDYLWTDIFPTSSFEDEEALLSSNFDYEMLSDGTKRVYIDIGLKMNHVAIMFRSGIEFDGRENSWADVFTHDFIFLLVNASVQNCYQAYSEFCEEHNKLYPYNLDINDVLPETITNSIIEQYVTYRSISDVEHAYLINNIGVECEIDADMSVAFKCTFAILDEILFTNPAFNKAHNREAFSDYVPIQRYATLKHNCMQPEAEVVQLSFYDTIMFFQCLDCALQMLVGDKFDRLLLAVEAKGIDKNMSTTFIKVGTEMFAVLRKMLQSSNARIINIENLPDWNSIIR